MVNLSDELSELHDELQYVIDSYFFLMMNYSM